MKHVRTLLIIFFTIFLIFFSYYLIRDIGQSAENRKDYEKERTKIISHLSSVYDFHVYIPSFLSCTEKFARLNPLLYGSGHSGLNKKIQFFLRQTDSIMGFSEAAREIFMSPADLFIRTDKNTITGFLIVFDYFTDQNDENIDNPIFSKYFKKFISDKHKFFYIGNENLTLNEKELLKKYLSNDTILKNPDEIIITGKKSIDLLLHQSGFDVCTNAFKNTSPEVIYRIRIPEDEIMIRTDRKPLPLYSGLWKENAVFTFETSGIFNISKIEKFPKDTIAGFNILKSVQQSLETFVISVNNSGKGIKICYVNDKELFQNSFHYLTKNRSDSLAFLSDHFFNFPDKISTVKALIPFNDYLILSDSSDYRFVTEQKEKLISDAMYLKKQFPDEIQFAGIYQWKTDENLSDTIAIHYVRTLKIWSGKERSVLELRLNKLSEKDPDAVFESPVSLKCGPFEFLNHNTGEKEWIVQDKNNTMYLVGDNGRLVHSFPAKSSVDDNHLFMVDMFNNKKIQMLFKGDNKIHLIDRNGKYINAYPFQIHSAILSPLSVITYQTGETRVWFSCKDKKIYSYTLFTLRPEGFVPYSMPDFPLLPVEYVSFINSDYLFTIDKTGNIHSFGRKGDPRIGFKNKSVTDLQEYAVINKGSFSNSYIMYFDKTGQTIHKVYLNDKKEIVPLPFREDKILTSYIMKNENLFLILCSSENLYRVDENANLKEQLSVPFVPDKIVCYEIKENKKFLYLIWKKDGRTMLFSKDRIYLEVVANSPPLLGFDEKKQRFIFTYIQNNRMYFYYLKNL